MSILIDSRVGSRDLHALLPRGYAELTSLEFGDAVVVGNGPTGPITEAFERKRLADVLSCIRDGRFAGFQLKGLRSDYDFVWLVVEDEIRAHPTTGILQRRFESRVSRVKSTRRRGARNTHTEGRWVDAMFGAKSTMMWRDFMHWLLTMRRKGGIDDFTFTRNARETADLIWIVHTWRQKKWKQHKSCDVFNTSQDHKGLVLFRPTGVTKLIMETARPYEGVGYDTAMAIAHHFEGVEDFIRASAEELAEIVVTEREDGAKVRLGKVLAKSIVEQRKMRRSRR